jgi:hypothetical protein
MVLWPSNEAASGEPAGVWSCEALLFRAKLQIQSDIELRWV